MDTGNSSVMSAKDRLDLVRWLIESYDGRKASVAGRASILLSADALLLAATTFLIEKLFPHLINIKLFEKTILIIVVAISLILLVASIAVATSGIANIWKTHKRKYRGNVTSRLYFYPRQTFEKYKSFKEFSKSFDCMHENQMIQEALGHLWVITMEYNERYGNLRKATRLLAIAIFPLVLSIIYVLFRSTL